MQLAPLRGLAACLLLVACAQTGSTDPADLREGIAARYEPSFLAVQGALDDRDVASAEAVLKRLRSQLEREASSGGGDVAGEARAAMELADGFERIVEGRKRLAALDMGLELAPDPDGGPNHELFLVVTSAWDGPLQLEPGPANLVLARSQVDQAGRQATMSRTLTLDALRPEIAPGEAERISLGSFPSRVSGDALAERLVFRLEVRAGEIIEGKERYPAQRYAVPPLEYVGLAPFLPTAALDPAELANYLQRPEPASAPIMERAIRILPARRGEALGLIRPLVERATELEFQRMAPALQWLAPDGPGVSGRERWVRWLERQPTE